MARLAFALLLVAAAAFGKPNRGPFKRIAVIHLREESSEQIDASVKTSVLRRIEEIREWGPDCVVFDIESYGGLVTASIETGDEIYALGREIHTIAFVARKAISGAAMLSMACQEIVMNEVANLGDSQVVYMSPQGQLEVAPEKMQGPVAKKFKTYAEGNGYPAPLAIAMVRQEAQVTRYKKPVDPRDGSGEFEWVYYRTDQIDSGPTRRTIEEERLYDAEVIVNEGELATFTAREAVEYGLCSRTVPTLDALLGEIKAPEAEVRAYVWNWAERTSRWLLGMRPLLFLLGAGALYFALKVPGTGIPEVLALICFGLFFGASAVAGFAGALEVILFFVGILLLVVEIFILPGFGVAGFLGLGCILASVALAAIPQGADLPAPPSYYLLPVARDFLLGAIGALVMVFLIARHLPKVPLFRSLRLEAAVPQTGGAVAQPEAIARQTLLGMEGVAETQLRPAGVARIGGQKRDVVADGAFVTPGTPVKVVEIRGNAIIVRPVNASA